MKNIELLPQHKILKLFFVLFISTFSNPAKSQENNFSRADTLRGSLTSKFRTCYDVTFYHLDVDINIDQQFISGSNEVHFSATESFKTLQIDLYRNLNIEKILFSNKALKFTREEDAVFISFPREVEKGSNAKIKIFYSGYPTIATHAPWDGGFVFSKDSYGNPFIGVACQGIGASSWWPNKDQLADRPDSMLISINIPEGKYINVSNGRLKSIKDKGDYKQYNWFISSPINNYNVTFNIGNYTLIKDTYKGLDGNLDIDYYVLEHNAEKAKEHFDKDVKRTL
ncbi:M1 family peptidase, partial [Pseudoxanthomonas sp. SGD-10]